MCKRNGLAQRLVQAKRASQRAGNLVNLQGVGHPGSLVIPYMVDEYLGFVHQAAEGGAVNNAISVTFKASAPIIRPFLEGPTLGVTGSAGGRVQVFVFPLLFLVTVHELKE